MPKRFRSSICGILRVFSFHFLSKDSDRITSFGRLWLSLILENRFVKNEGDNHAFYLHFCDSLDEIAIAPAAEELTYIP
jgi:hypothetical protein